ncbi:MAG: DUF2207 domain-containing protein [Chitinophagales bacterium]
MNKKIIFLILIFIFSIKFLSATEKIYLFKANIEVEENGDLLIEEIINVKAEGYNIKRGIYRAIPNKYKTKKGLNFKVDIKVEAVLKNGRKENFHTKVENGLYKIYVGNKDEFLNPGDYYYTIKYKTDNQIGFYENFDELYWNVNGNDWDFQIDKVEANITLPNTARIEQNAAYTGFRGESGKDYKVELTEPNKIHFESTRIFSAGENLTIGTGWQKGIIKEPTASDKLMKLLKDNLFLLIGIFGTLLAFLIHLFNWKKVGVDPEEGTIIPLFKPMNGLSPSAMRYILKMKMDDKAFTAAIVSMATKGVLKIEKKSSIYHLIKEQDADLSKLSSSELALYNTIFTRKSLLKISNTNHSEISKAMNTFNKKEEDLHQETYFKLNRKHLIAGIVISVVTMLLMFLSIGLDLSLVSFFPGFPILIFIIVMFKNVPSIRKNLGGALIGVAFIGLFVLFPFIGSVGLSTIQIVTMLIVLLLLLFINFLFAYLMKAPTLFGRKEMDKIEGFKMYLKTAEELRLDSHNIPNKTPELFEAYLPYAIALDCENQWAKKFENILAEAKEAGTYRQPTWYIGGGNTFSPSTLTRDIGGRLNNAVNNASMAPSQRGSSSGGGWSGGSSGGGFSGGGGGGGGGGGW